MPTSIDLSTQPTVAQVTTQPTTAPSAPVAPSAPSPKGKVAAPRVNPYPDSVTAISGDMTMAALRIMSGADDRKQRLDMKMKVAAGQTELGAKSAGVKAAVDQNKGELSSAVQKFAAGAAGGALNTKLAMHAAGGVGDKDNGARKAAINSITQNGSLTQTINSGSDALDQAIGGQSEANKAKVAAKFAELGETQAKILGDGAKQATEADAKAQDGLVEFAKSAYERAAQVINKAFGG